MLGSMSSGWLLINCNTAKIMISMLSRVKGAVLKIGGSLTLLMPGGSLTTSVEKGGFLLFLLEFSGAEDEQFHFVLGIINLTEEENFLCYSPHKIMVACKGIAFFHF